MKRFLLFAGPDYYPTGGWTDFVGAFDTLDEAAQAAGPENDWFHVVDSEAGGIVWPEVEARVHGDKKAK